MTKNIAIGVIALWTFDHNYLREKIYARNFITTSTYWTTILICPLFPNKDKTNTMIPSQETHQSLWVEAVEAVSFSLTKINSSYMFLLAFPLGNERVVTSKSNLPTCFYNTLLHENWNVCWVRKFLSTIAESLY